MCVLSVSTHTRLCEQGIWFMYQVSGEGTTSAPAPVLSAEGAALSSPAMFLSSSPRHHRMTCALPSKQLCDHHYLYLPDVSSISPVPIRAAKFPRHGLPGASDKPLLRLPPATRYQILKKILTITIAAPAQPEDALMNRVRYFDASWGVISEPDRTPIWIQGVDFTSPENPRVGRAAYKLARTMAETLHYLLQFPAQDHLDYSEYGFANVREFRIVVASETMITVYVGRCYNELYRFDDSPGGSRFHGQEVPWVRRAAERWRREDIDRNCNEEQHPFLLRPVPPRQSMF